MFKLTITDRVKHSKSLPGANTVVELQGLDQMFSIVPEPYANILLSMYRDKKPNMFGIKHAYIDDIDFLFTYTIQSEHPEFRNEKKISKLNNAKRR